VEALLLIFSVYDGAKSASNQRAKQRPEGRTRADADACVGVAKDPELDQNDHNNEDPDEKREERRGERQVMELAGRHRRVTRSRRRTL
jgi:hypothetical protein